MISQSWTKVGSYRARYYRLPQLSMLRCVNNISDKVSGTLNIKQVRVLFGAILRRAIMRIQVELLTVRKSAICKFTC